MFEILGALAALLIMAAVISLVISFLGNVILGALSLLPVVLIVLAVWFFVRGGKIRIEFPDRDD